MFELPKQITSFQSVVKRNLNISKLTKLPQIQVISEQNQMEYMKMKLHRNIYLKNRFTK